MRSFVSTRESLAGERSRKPRFYSVAEVAAIFGLSPMTVYRAIAAGEFVKGHEVLPMGGHESCPVVATRSARSWPPEVPGLLVQSDHSFAGHGLGEANAVAAGLAEVGVVE
jgi:hypothetical protein